MRKHLSREERRARNVYIEFSAYYRFPLPDPDDLDYIQHRLEGMVDWIHNQKTIDGTVKASIIYGRRKIPKGIHVRIRALGSKQNALSLAQMMQPLSRWLERLMQYQGGDRPKLLDPTNSNDTEHLLVTHGDPDWGPSFQYVRG